MGKNSILGAISLALAASIWGGMYVVSKYVLQYIPPITLVWLRYVIALSVLLLVHFYYRKKDKKTTKNLTKKDLLLFLWIGFIGYFVSISFQFIGTKLSNAHLGALITSASPAFIVLFARIWLRESLTLQKVTALLLSSIGVIIVIGWHIEDTSNLWGNIILVGAAITWALLSVFVKIASRSQPSLTITIYSILFALLFTTPTMLWELHTQSVHFHSPLIIWGILYLGVISTAVAFFLWNKGFELMDAGVGSLFFFFQPIVGSLLGWLLLKETLNLNFYFGGALILIGVVIATYKRKRTSVAILHKKI